MKRKVKWLIGGVIFLIIVILLIFFSIDGEPVANTVRVEKGDIVQEVNVTGVVRPREEVDLSFQQGGILKSTPFSVGGKVRKGDVIATQESSEIEASLREAEASVRVEEARLEALKGGNRTQEIFIKEAELKNAKTDLSNLYNDASTIIQSVQNDVDKVLNDDIDALFSNDNSSDTQLTFFVTSQSVEFLTENGRTRARDAHSQIITLKNNLLTGLITPEDALTKTLSGLGVIESFLNDLGEALNFAVGVSDATLATYKTDANTARASINTAINSIEKKSQNINTNKFTIEKLNQELDLLREGSREEDITAQTALLEKAKATSERINAQLRKTVLHSPINGVITKINADMGEAVQGSFTVVSVVSQGNFEISTQIPEADIVMVSTGDIARITLDALNENDIFTARVVLIDPAETIIDGVATYKVTLIFDDDRGLARSGMTANVDIETDSKNDVLYLPSRAVIREAGKEYVRMDNNGTIEERYITTGIKDVLGNIEIISGLKEGEEVITFISKE